MAVIENKFSCDLSKPVQAQALKGNVFSLDNLGSRLSVLIYDNGEPATISGSVTANCILPDGSTVNVNGGLTTEGDGSKAYVDIPQSCLLIPGILKIAIKCTSSSVITTLAAIVANVYMTKTDNVITPSQQIIDDWNAEISAAIAGQNAQISDLKSAVNDGYGVLFGIQSFFPSTATVDVGYTINSSGVVITNPKRCILERWRYDNAPWEAVGILGNTYEYIIFIYTANNASSFVRKLSNNYVTGETVLPKDGNYFYAAFKRKDNADMTSSDATAILQEFARYELTDKTLTLSNIPADSKTVGDTFTANKSEVESVNKYNFISVVGNHNLFELSNVTTGAYINNDGEIVQYANGRYTTNPIPITSDCFTIGYRGRGTDVNIRTVGYDANGDFVKVVDLFSTGTGQYIAEKTLATDSGIASIRISYSVNADIISVIDGTPVKKWIMNRRYSDMKSYGEQPAADGSSGSFCNTLTGTYADLLNAVYEPLRTQYPNYITRTVIGRDASDTYDIYAYTFEPRYYQQSILLNAGIHAQETDSIACLARFCQMVANATSEQPDLYFIRQNVKMTIVPVMNVWGFSQSPHSNTNAYGYPTQRFTTFPLIAEDQALASLVESLKGELSFIVDMHTTTNDTYLDFYGIVNRFAPNVRTLFKVNAWLCDHYAKDGRTVDDQYFGYRTSTHTFNAYCWNTYKIPCSTLELSDYHWGDIGSDDAITMGVTMWANYIIQQINDSYNHVDVIPFADYREVKG